MKKKGTLLLLLIAVFMLLFAYSAPAMAAGQYTTITRLGVENGDVGSLSDLKMLDSTKKTKVITLEKAAADYLIKQNKTITADFGDWVIGFSPKIFQSAEVAKAVATGEYVTYRLTFETAPKASVERYFSDITQSGKGNYRLKDGEFTLDVEIYTGTKVFHTIKNLPAPITITYDYNWNINDYNAKEAKLTYAWLDMEAAEDGKNVEWHTMKGANVNTQKHTFTVDLTKGTGYYLPVASNNGMGENATGGGNGGTGDAYVPIPAGHWAASDIENMQNNLVVPYNLAGINLSAPISRGEFASYIVKALRLSPNTTASGKFTDVPANYKYATDIYTGVASGILKGISENKFAPNAQISRQEMAILFQRALENKEASLNKDAAKLQSFLDAAKVSPWAAEGAAVAVNAGLIRGQNGNYFAPKANATWAEAVVMLNRLYEQLF